jgi:hypothetical protein
MLTLPVCDWGNLKPLLENAAEVGDILEAALKRDSGDVLL